MALAGLVQEETEANGRTMSEPNALKAESGSLFAPKAKRIIFMFMHGGPSQVDTFDYKPALQRDDNKPYPQKKPRIVSGATGNLLASPWKFRQYGESGIHVSDLFPNVGQLVDDLCIVNSVHGSNSRHGAALLELHTGSDTFIRPSMGSWINYGLGTENEKSAWLHHDLPDVWARRRERLVQWVSTRALSGYSDRNVPALPQTKPKSPSSKTIGSREKHNAWSSTF